MTSNGPKNPSKGESNKKEISKEISNVELQFMGQPDPKEEQQATIQAENQLGGGLDSEDEADAETLDASDPLGSNP